MKKFSRILALLLIVLMLATLSVSCKKAEDEEEAFIDNGSSESGDSGNSDSQGGSNSGSEDKVVAGEGEVHGEGAGRYETDADGNIVSTGDLELNADFVIQETVTNEIGFIPDEEQGLEKSERRATEASKYDFDKNPLINRDRQQNQKAMPSFDINDTGFVRAGTKISDLKGKTLQFFTADNFAAWSYRNAKGETIDEWEWFKELKKEVGLNIKYTVKQHQSSINAALQYMNAGKQCDIIYTNHNVQPQALCISKSITSLVNINNLGSSPGVCKTTMDLCKWGNTLRLIAPIGVVDCVWYNQTLAQELGLSDPHSMWEAGQWDWDAYKKFLTSAPTKTKDGRELCRWINFSTNIPFTWPQTNGKGQIEIVSDAAVPTIKNNWDDPQVLAALEFIAGVQNEIGYKASGETVAGAQKEHVGLYEGTTLMSATMYTQVYRDTEYSKTIRINWVPFPKANTSTGVECAQYYGFGMVLPKKSAKEKVNENIALKFMELWATRFTETYFDNLLTFEYYHFNYVQRKQYFDFVTKHVVFSPSFSGFYEILDQEGTCKFYAALSGNAAYNVKTECVKGKNLAAAYIDQKMKFGS